MKYLKILSLLFITVVFAGCSEEEREDKSPENIVGRWYRLGMSQTNGFSYHTNACPSNYDYREYFADGTGTTTTFSASCVENQSNFSWRIEGAKLIVGSQTSNLVSLSANEMTLEITSTAPSTGTTVTGLYVYYR